MQTFAPKIKRIKPLTKRKRIVIVCIHKITRVQQQLQICSSMTSHIDLFRSSTEEFSIYSIVEEIRTDSQHFSRVHRLNF